jgi:hypothetical protein
MPFVKVAFYTSMTRKNALPAVEYLSYTESEQLFLYEQRWNKRDPHGENAWSMMRDLPRLWGSKEGSCGPLAAAAGSGMDVGSLGPAFGHSEKDTIMIDDSFAKMREFPSNVVLIPEFDEEAVLGALTKGEDEFLGATLARFFEIILDAWQEQTFNNAEPDIRTLVGTCVHQIEKLSTVNPHL